MNHQLLTSSIVLVLMFSVVQSTAGDNLTNNIPLTWLRLFGVTNSNFVLDKSHPIVKKLYTFGTRYYGDYKIDVWNYEIRFDTVRNDGHCIYYSAKLSHAQFIVDQTSEVGSAFIRSGGIGKDHVMFCIEARNTTFLGIHAEIYGVNTPNGKFSEGFLPLPQS